MLSASVETHPTWKVTGLRVALTQIPEVCTPKGMKSQSNGQSRCLENFVLAKGSSSFRLSDSNTMTEMAFDAQNPNALWFFIYRKTVLGCDRGQQGCYSPYVIAPGVDEIIAFSSHRKAITVPAAGVQVLSASVETHPTWKVTGLRVALTQIPEVCTPKGMRSQSNGQSRCLENFVLAKGSSSFRLSDSNTITEMAFDAKNSNAVWFFIYRKTTLRCGRGQKSCYSRYVIAPGVDEIIAFSSQRKVITAP